MKTKTYPVKFDKSMLPLWAQKDALIVTLCAGDLAFRCEVATAHTPRMKGFLRNEALRRHVMQRVLS